MQKIFHPKYDPGQSIFEIKLYKNGEINVVLIDNFVPSTESKPVFSSGPEWVLLLEKAWAAVHGSYKNIFIGDSSETLRDILGAPTKNYPVEGEYIFNKIDDAIHKNFLVTA